MPVGDAAHPVPVDGDQALFEQLHAVGFSGPTWHTATRHIAAYCLEVVTAWLQTKMIFRKCAEKGYRLPRSSLRLHPAEISDLAADTVTAALNAFRTRALAGKGWRHDGGKSLTSWITDDCIFAFPNVWRSWLSRVQPAQRAEALEILVSQWPDDLNLEPSPEDIAMARCEGDLALVFARPVLKRAVHLLSLGYTQAETCEILGEGLTPRALEGQLHRLRRRLSEQKEA